MIFWDKGGDSPFGTVVGQAVWDRGGTACFETRRDRIGTE